MNNLKKYALNEIPHYKVHGRTVPGANPLPLFFNGSAVELNVSGAELWATWKSAGRTWKCGLRWK